jgi:hypothetical protein
VAGVGHAIWKKRSGYHHRSLVEAKMYPFKWRVERVMARTFERQMVELHVRVRLFSPFAQLWSPTTVTVTAMA